MEIFESIRQNSIDKAIPLQASLELTNRCNERCTHCYLENFYDDPDKILSLQDWYNILDELRSAGTLYLVLMGGEAMLSPFFWPLAERAAQLGFHVSLITNGLKINSLEVAKKLKKIGFSHISFSLYSLDSEIHDKMTTVKGSCIKTQKAIEYCVEVGVPSGVNCLLTKNNIKSVFDLEDWCIRIGVELRVDPNVTAKLDGGLEPVYLRATKESLQWFYMQRLMRWPNSRPKGGIELESNYVCNAAKGKCAVTAYGELLPCIEIREPFGLLHKTAFSDLWNSPLAAKWRNIKVKDIKNKTDDLYGFCDHCPGMAKNEYGDPYTLSKDTIEIAEIKRQVSLAKI